MLWVNTDQYGRTCCVVNNYADHEYIGVQSNDTTLSVELLSKSNTSTMMLWDKINDHCEGNPNVELWGGEIANRNRGGNNWGQTFGTAFWYMDALGVKASLKNSVFFRQDLFGMLM